MTFVGAIKSSIDKSLNFSGRASRSDFWKFLLFLAIVYTLGETLATSGSNYLNFAFGLKFGIGPDYSWFMNIYTTIFFIPFVSSSVRRFNDAGYVFAHYFALLFALFACLLMWAKFTGGTIHIVLILVTIVIVFGGFIYITTRKSISQITQKDHNLPVGES